MKRIKYLICASFILIAGGVSASDYFINITNVKAKVINENTNEPVTPSFPALNNVCSIRFSNMSTPTWYKIGLDNISLLTKNDVPFDFGTGMAAGNYAFFTNATVAPNLPYYAHNSAMGLIKGYVTEGYNAESWIPESKSFEVSILLKSPIDLYGISYVDMFSYSGSHYINSVYNVSVYDCNKKLLFSKNMTSRISTFDKEEGVLRFESTSTP